MSKAQQARSEQVGSGLKDDYWLQVDDSSVDFKSEFAGGEIPLMALKGVVDGAEFTETFACGRGWEIIDGVLSGKPVVNENTPYGRFIDSFLKVCPDPIWDALQSHSSLDPKFWRGLNLHIVAKNEAYEAFKRPDGTEQPAGEKRYLYCTEVTMGAEQVSNQEPQEAGQPGLEKWIGLAKASETYDAFAEAVYQAGLEGDPNETLVSSEEWYQANRG